MHIIPKSTWCECCGIVARDFGRGQIRETEQSRPVAYCDRLAAFYICQLHIAYIIPFILLTSWLKCKFIPSFYPFYMFYTAKTFSVHRRVRNHYTKRTLNLILNRKRFLRRENDPLDKQKPRQIRREPSPPCKATVLQRLSRTAAVPTKEVDW